MSSFPANFPSFNNPSWEPFAGTPFTPMYIFPNEFDMFGLPSVDKEPEIENIVQTVSGMVDTFCGRLDGDGNGSLVYTTYTQRLMAQAPGRNLAYLPIKPLVALNSTFTQGLQSLASNNMFQASTLGLAVTGNFFFTGVLPSVNTLSDGRLSAILGASGRYTYQRRSTYPLDNDPLGIVTPLNAQTIFGGPPPWIPIDMINLDYDERTGEVWYAAGQWVNRYTEVVWKYNSGYDPTNMHPIIKRSVAQIVKNYLAKGKTTGMKNFRMMGSGINAQFEPDIIDPTVQRWLQSFVATRVY